MPPHPTATACTPAAFAARMSNGESPTYAASSGRASRRSSAASSGSGAGLWRSVSSEAITTSKFCSSSGSRSKARRTVACRLAVTMPRRRPCSRSRGSTSITSQNASSPSCSGSLCSRYAATRSSTRSGASASICATSPGPPTAAASTSSGISRPRTDFAACFIDATIIGPESIRVPSRSKRTTGKRTRSIVVTRSVLDADQVEAVRRGGLARRAAGLPFEERGKIMAVEHRADERPHHVTQERVRGDLEVEVVAAFVPLRGLDHADENIVLRLRRRECAEVVLPGEELGAAAQGPHVERLRPPPTSAPFERAALAPPVEPVTVRPRPGREARVEARPRLLGGHDGDVVGQERVQRLGRALHRRTTGDVDGDRVAERVHARIRSARHGEPVKRCVQGREDPANLAFDRPQAGLRGPAAEVRAVVLEGELETQTRRLRGGGFGLFGLAPAAPPGALGLDVPAVRNEVDELEVGHRRRVALARAELHDPRVAARPVDEPRRDLGEELVHDLLRPQEGERLAAGVNRALAAERDHLLRDRPHRLRLRLGRADPAVLDQRRRQVRVQRLAMRRVAAELLPRALVPQAGSSSPRNVRPCAASVSLTSSIDFLPKFGIVPSSVSVLETRSPMVSMPTRFRQLYERTPSSSSSIGKFSIPCASDGSAACSAAASAKPSIFSMSVKIASWRISSSAACAIASRGSIEPSVVTSRTSLS